MSQFTKRAIIESFVSLLNLNPLDKITVKDIVEKCGINRNTFYYYYRDIYALLDDIFRTEIKRALEEDGEIEESWQEGFLRATAFVMENKRAVYHVYHSMNREYLEHYLYQVTGNLMLRFVRKQAEGMPVKEEDIRLIADFYKCALVGMSLGWLEEGMKRDPEVIVRRMGVLLEGNIQAMLQKGLQMKAS